MVGFCEARDEGAKPGRSDDVRDGVIGGQKTPKTDGGSAVQTEEDRGVGDHVRWGCMKGGGQCHQVKTYPV